MINSCCKRRHWNVSESSCSLSGGESEFCNLCTRRHGCSCCNTQILSGGRGRCCWGHSKVLDRVRVGFAKAKLERGQWERYSRHWIWLCHVAFRIISHHRGTDTLSAVWWQTQYWKQLHVTQYGKPSFKWNATPLGSKLRGFFVNHVVSESHNPTTVWALTKFYTNS